MDLNHLHARLEKAKLRNDKDQIEEYEKKIKNLEQKNASNRNAASNQDDKSNQQSANKTDVLNHLKARLIKAEITGDEKLVKELSTKIKSFENAIESKVKLVDELNHLKARLMKAEMKGDENQIEQLNMKIEELESEVVSNEAILSTQNPIKQNGKSTNQYHNLSQSKHYERIEEMNRLNAKMIKAELKNDKKQVDDYKKKIEELQILIDSAPSTSKTNESNEDNELNEELNWWKARLKNAENKRNLEVIDECKARIFELTTKNGTIIEPFEPFEPFKIKPENEDEMTDINEEKNELNVLTAKLMRAEFSGNKELIEYYKKLIEEAKEENEKPKDDKEVVFIKKQENLSHLFNEIAKAQQSNEKGKLDYYRRRLREVEDKYNFKDKDDLLRFIKIVDDILTDTVKLKEEEEINGHMDLVKELDKKAKLIRKSLVEYRSKMENLNHNVTTKPKRDQRFDLASRIHPLCGKSSSEQEEERKRENERKNTKVIKVIRKPNENSMSLKQMFVSERESSVRSDTMRFVNASTRVRDADDEYEASFKDPNLKKQKIMYVEEEDDKCNLCIENINKHSLISYDDKIVLIIPDKEPLLDNQIIIRSVAHSLSLANSNEDVIENVNQYKQKLCSLFESMNMKLIFIEYFLANYRRNRHFEINCYPIKSSIFEESKMYFKKGFEFADFFKFINY